MPSRASASARFGPTPLRYLTEVANCSVTPLPPSPAVHRQFTRRSTRRSPAYQALGVRLSVKHFEILKPFPGTDKTDRHGTARCTATTLPPFAVPSSFVT